MQPPRPIDPEIDEDVVLRFAWEPSRDPAFLEEREWILTNGLGGYASGTLSGRPTRRYHGIFVPNLRSPHGRTVIVPRLEEQCLTDAAEAVPLDPSRLSEFRLEWQIPTWTFQWAGRTLEKRIVMPYGQSTAHVQYRLLNGAPLELQLRPYVTFRPHDEKLGPPEGWHLAVLMREGRFEVQPPEGLPALKMALRPGAGVFVADPVQKTVRYPVEKERGLDFEEELGSPGYFAVRLRAGESTAFVASVEPWEFLGIEPDRIFEAERERLQKLLVRAAPALQRGWARHLVLAADQFLVSPGSRVEESALLQAAGDPVRTVIAGYHWFTDWGRDTMISFEGLTLCTGRFREARAILRTFAHYVKDGLLPNHFPEGQGTALYHTADATFWYFHAMDRYLKATDDTETLAHLFPILQSIIEHHLKGTHFGIRMDSDGLIMQGTPEWPLTWMDAKAGDWIVTPRRGKPVEIQALWYNALRLMQSWCQTLQPQRSELYGDLAEQAYASFNDRFWFEAGSYLYDVVDGPNGDDPRIRPNQIFSLSLPHPVLNPSRWDRVLEMVGHRLWTPVGLRSLDPADPDYKARYAGDRLSRDGAYHQGLVWGWLAGPYVDAWCRVHASREHVAHLMKGFQEHLRDGGIGTISEIFDAEQPHTPRACIAQAWSVAEALRILAAEAPVAAPVHTAVTIS